MKRYQSKRKSYSHSSIDIPILGNDSEIIWAYCDYFGLNEQLMGLKNLVNQMREKLLNKSIEYYSRKCT